MHPRETPKRVQSRRKAQPGCTPGELCNAEWACFGASPFGPGYPRALGRVALLARAAARAARRALPRTLGHPGAGAFDCLSASGPTPSTAQPVLSAASLCGGIFSCHNKI